MLSHPHARIIVNPVAGSGLTGRKWPGIRVLLGKLGLPFDYVFTEGIGHAMELARESVIAGYEMVVAAGGDGTLNEVVNGLVDSGSSTSVTLGILNTGSECDFARFLGIPRDCEQALMGMASLQTTPVDIGVVEYQKEGQPAHRFFLNNASFGLDGEVAQAALKSTGLLRGSLPYVLGFVRCLFTYRNKNIQLQVADETENLRILSLIIANGGLFAGGMRVAPEADLSDGLLDVAIVGDMGKLELLRAFPSVYRGKHVGHPKVRLVKTDRITVQSTDRVLIQADGEFVGEAPATFRVLPSALNVAVCTGQSCR